MVEESKTVSSILRDAVISIVAEAALIVYLPSALGYASFVILAWLTKDVINNAHVKPRVAQV
jgi:hypothetical protein